MKTVNFKTNINCGSCLTSVTPILNDILGADNWSVDLSQTDKVLTVNSNEYTAEIIKRIEDAGYNIEVKN